MASLPSFVELMASLGLNQTTKTPDYPSKSTFSSPSASPRLIGAAMPSHSRSKSTQSLRDSASRAKISRYSPYSTNVTDIHQSMNELSVNVYGSVSDLAANTPISSYVRRKTPGGSPTSPTFSSHERDDSPPPPTPLIPVTVPTIPNLWPTSASSDTFPLTPKDSELLDDYSFGEAVKGHRRGRHSVGIRISTPPRSADLTPHYPRSRSLAHLT
ncbi:hypothetical protein H0H93_008335 [Arthromyces matolae]|nr:hypothetical protein H0H93_008335 [Arthromyces matolae]